MHIAELFVQSSVVLELERLPVFDYGTSKIGRFASSIPKSHSSGKIARIFAHLLDDATEIIETGSIAGIEQDGLVKVFDGRRWIILVFEAVIVVRDA